MINHDPQVRVETSGSLSVLFLSALTPRASGNYTCAPSNARPATIRIHVLNGRSAGVRSPPGPAAGARLISPRSQTTKSRRRFSLPLQQRSSRRWRSPPPSSSSRFCWFSAVGVSYSAESTLRTAATRSPSKAFSSATFKGFIFSCTLEY